MAGAARGGEVGTLARLATWVAASRACPFPGHSLQKYPRVGLPVRARGPRVARLARAAVLCPSPPQGPRARRTLPAGRGRFDPRAAAASPSRGKRRRRRRRRAPPAARGAHERGHHRRGRGRRGGRGRGSSGRPGARGGDIAGRLPSASRTAPSPANSAPAPAPALGDAPEAARMVDSRPRTLLRRAPSPPPRSPQRRRRRTAIRGARGGRANARIRGLRGGLPRRAPSPSSPARRESRSARYGHL